MTQGGKWLVTLVALGGLYYAITSRFDGQRKESDEKTEAVARAKASAAARLADVAKPAKPADEPLPEPERTLAAAIGKARPAMDDSLEKPDEGAFRLGAHWALGRYAWAELQALPETTFGRVRKDSDAERGKRLCGSGEVVEIEAVRTLGTKVHSGRVLTDGGDVLTVIAAGDTGTLERGSRGRFCGVVTGRHSYANSGGGTTHSAMLVGMFDLPANKTKPTPAASAKPSAPATSTKVNLAPLGSNYVSPITSGHLPIWKN
ncbi:MAG: hypothetical protein MUF34_19620 [Polyangiaceae bacterium]|jgi:hypothetical protein|nr:hypothetical protein [Polyangiaceae bacterium]